MWHDAVMKLFTKKGKRLYLDYAAATPIHPKVSDLITSTQKEFFGNPSAIHYEGVQARGVVENSRLKLARCLGIKPAEVIFTASGTEANNLAIYGLIKYLVTAGRQLEEMAVMTTAIEHPSVYEVLGDLARQGLSVVTVDVDEVGKINLVDFANKLSKQTVLATFAYANSEIGVVQDVKKIARLIKKFNLENNLSIKVHLDASQAPLWLTCQPHSLGIDMMTLDAGKCNGPKGVGMLIKLRGVKLAPHILGGGQEAGLRAGTENVALIAGGVEAVILAQANFAKRSRSVYESSLALVAGLKQAIPNLIFNGPDFVQYEELERLPHNVHISIQCLDTEFAVIVLDKHGISASTKSACSGASGGASKVVSAISGDARRALSTIRFTIDPELKISDMKRVVTTLKDHVMQMHSVDQRGN